MKYETILGKMRKLYNMRMKANFPTEFYINTSRSGKPIAVIGFGVMPVSVDKANNMKNLYHMDGYQELSYAQGDETAKLNPDYNRPVRLSLQEACTMINSLQLDADQVVKARQNFRRKVLTYMDTNECV